MSLFLHPVREFIARSPVTAGPRTGVRELARQMAAAGVGSVVIVGEDGAPAGIVTDRDLRAKVVAEGRDPAATVAADVMSSPLVTVAPGAYGFEALLEMTRRGIHHLVVLEAGRLARRRVEPRLPAASRRRTRWRCPARSGWPGRSTTSPGSARE